MSYKKAQECFEDNIGRVNARENPLEHNLNVGLYQLTQALKTDIREINRKLDAIDRKDTARLH